LSYYHYYCYYYHHYSTPVGGSSRLGRPRIDEDIGDSGEELPQFGLETSARDGSTTM